MKLWFKIFLGIIGIIFCLFVLNIFFVYKVAEKSSIKNIKNAEVLFAKSLAVRFFRDIAENKNIKLTAALFDEKRLREEKLEYILVFDRKGYLLAYTHFGDMPKRLLKLNNTFDAKSKYRIERIENNENSVYDVAVPVMEGIAQVGAIHVGIKLAYLQKVAKETSRVLIIIMAISSVLGILIAIVMSNFLVKPIKELIRATFEIGKGNLSTRIKISSKDEIGQLAESFNLMAMNLNNTTVSRDSLINEIKERKMAEEERIKVMVSLEKQNKELEEFTWIISHDLKEPLRSINAFSKFVMDGYIDKLDEEGQLYLMRINANTSKLHRLIEDIIEFSYIGKKPKSFESVDVQTIIDEINRKLEYVLAQITIKDKLPVIWCDREALTVVFTNIIFNAVKFADKSPIVIEIGCKEKETVYEFYVKDNGPGIEEKYFDKIFVMFQRLCKKETYEGSGAGLAISKKIVEMHNGKIWVESKLGEGSIFYFSIPKNK